MKSPALSLHKRQTIGKHKDKFPKATIADIAKQYNVSYNQAYKAVKDWQAGDLHRTRPRPKPLKLAESLKIPADTLLETQYHTAVAGLNSNDKLAVDERVGLLDKLFAMRKTLQQVKLEGHIKRADAVVIAAIVRKFKPEASDEDVIAIYREIMTELKL